MWLIKKLPLLNCLNIVRKDCQLINVMSELHLKEAKMVGKEQKCYEREREELKL